MNAGNLDPEALAKEFASDPNISGGLAALGVVPINGGDFLTAQLPPPKWIIKDFIAVGMKGDIVAPAKCYKTYASMQLGICTTAGIDYLDKFKITEPHKAAYFNLELFDWNFQERLKAQTAALGADPEKLRENLLVFNLRGKALLLREHPEVFIDALVKFGAELAIIDPRYKLIDGAQKEDENTAAGLANFLSFRDKFAEHLAVAVVTHDPKGDTANRKGVDRGAGSYTAGADFDFRLTIDRADKWEKDNLVYVFDSEGRARPTPAPFGVRFNSDRQILTADEKVVPVKFGAKDNPKGDRKLKADATLHEQEQFRDTALQVVSRYGDNLRSIKTFKAAMEATRGGNVAILKADNYRSMIVEAGYLVTCPQIERKADGTLGKVKNGDTYISTRDHIVAYLEKFAPLAELPTAIKNQIHGMKL